MTKQEDIKRIERLLEYIGITSNAEDIWEDFSHEGFEKPWMETSEEELEEFIKYSNKLENITTQEVKRLGNIFIYFVLWVYKVHKE